MRHRFLIHELNHTTVLVDISDMVCPQNFCRLKGSYRLCLLCGFKAGTLLEQHLRVKVPVNRPLIGVENEVRV
jgi:hypothetical protein